MQSRSVRLCSSDQARRADRGYALVETAGAERDARIRELKANAVTRTCAPIRASTAS
jgi:hypothetical protein